MPDKKEYHVLMDGLVYDKYDTFDKAALDRKRLKDGIQQNISIKEDEITELYYTINNIEDEITELYYTLNNIKIEEVGNDR
jgi:hypothetical protein